jgi:hypothetical protein
MKKKIILLGVLLLAAPAAHGIVPVIPLLVLGLSAAVTASLGTGIYCTATTDCTNSTKHKQVTAVTASASTVPTTPLTTSKPATFIVINPKTTNKKPSVLTQAVDSASRIECDRNSRPNDPSIEIASASIFQIENQVRILTHAAGNMDHAILNSFINLRTTLCYTSSIMDRLRPQLRYDNPNNISEQINTVMRISDLLNRAQILLRELQQAHGERRLGLKLMSEIDQINQHQMTLYSAIFNFINQGAVNNLGVEGANAPLPAVVNFRIDLLYNYRESLINFISHNALRIARGRYSYGILSGQIQSDNVQRGFRERITSILNEADEGLIHIILSNARPMLEAQLSPYNPLINWEGVQNQLIEIANDTYDRMFVRITCIDPIKTNALHKACRHHNRDRFDE